VSKETYYSVKRDLLRAWLVVDHAWVVHVSSHVFLLARKVLWCQKKKRIQITFCTILWYQKRIQMTFCTEILKQMSALSRVLLYKGIMEEEEALFRTCACRRHSYTAPYQIFFILSDFFFALFRTCACRRHSYTAPSMPAETRLRYAQVSKEA